MHKPDGARHVRRGLLTAGAALMLAASLPLAATAAPQSGFKTKQPAMLAPGADAPLGTEIKPIITVGDTIGDYLFEAIPDGISYWQSGKNAGDRLREPRDVDRAVSVHRGTPTTANSFNDFVNSEVSELVIRKGGAVLSAEKVIDTWDGFHRFCSNFLATGDGFEDRPLLFTNEEGIDWVFEEVRPQRHPLGLEQRGVHRGRRRRTRDRRGRRIRPRERRAPADLGHGPAQPREQRGRARATGMPVHPVGRRLLRQQPGAVAGLLVHRRTTRTPSGTTRATCTRSSRATRTLRSTTTTTSHRVGHGDQRPVHPGAQGDRNGQEPGRLRHDGRGRAGRVGGPYPLPPADGDVAARHRHTAPASMARSGCSSTGAT